MSFNAISDLWKPTVSLQWQIKNLRLNLINWAHFTYMFVCEFFYQASDRKTQTIDQLLISSLIYTCMHMGSWVCEFVYMYSYQDDWSMVGEVRRSSAEIHKITVLCGCSLNSDSGGNWGMLSLCFAWSLRGLIKQDLICFSPFFALATF